MSGLLQTYCRLSIIEKLFVSWEFSETCGVINYGSGWRKNVVNKCLEFGYPHTPSIAFRHLPPNSARTGYADDYDVELHVLGCRLIWLLGTNCDQCRSMVHCCFTSTETVRLIRTESPGRPPRLSHSSWTLVAHSEHRFPAPSSKLCKI